MKRRIGSVYLLAESIINDLFRASGLDFDKHYKTFYRNGVPAIDETVEELKNRIIDEVRDKLSLIGIHEMYNGRIARRYNNLIDRESYVEGFNDCLEQHKVIMEEINEFILTRVQYAMENIEVVKKGGGE